MHNNSPGAIGAIDLHTHFVPNGWPDLRSPGSGRPAGEEPDVLTFRPETETEATIMLGSRAFRRIKSVCWDAFRVADDVRPALAAQETARFVGEVAGHRPARPMTAGILRRFVTRQ